ncbi:stage II sporulation protein P [Lachnospiraceae bacterium]|nr:stage II sporulation protein P [Lachnospiraceae bacterium]
MRMPRKVKIKVSVVAFLAIAVLAAGSLFGDMAREDSLLEKVAGHARSEAYLGMLKSAAPSVFYEKMDKSGMEYLLEWVLKAVPVYGYVTDEQEYTTQSESLISYETIISREAKDENYVDETTGEVVTSGESTPQLPKEETLLAEEPESTPQEETAGGQPDGSSFVPNQTPVVTYAKEKLNDFDYLIQNFYVVDRTTTINSSQLNAADLLGRSMKLTHGADAPQILIYHTHSQERYADSAPGDAATSIVGVGEYLTKLLGSYGFHVLHHTGEYDVDTRDDAYSRAGPVIEQILKDNPSIEIVIDLHRDGVAEGTHLVTDVQGKQTASIMFFNGLSRTTANGDISYLPNPYIQDNLAFSLQMQIAAQEYYPGFSRMIYLKGYRYNMHYCPKSLLVEVGAQTNTVQEAMNAMEPLADVLAKVISP